MEKIQFFLGDTSKTEEFYVLEQTKLNGSVYILVTNSDEGDGEYLILKEVSQKEGADAYYDVVEDETELGALTGIFEELLEDVDIEL